MDLAKKRFSNSGDEAGSLSPICLPIFFTSGEVVEYSNVRDWLRSPKDCGVFCALFRLLSSGELVGEVRQVESLPGALSGVMEGDGALQRRLRYVGESITGESKV